MKREKEILRAYQEQKTRLGNQEHTFMRGAKWADEHPRWISVEDELPPKDKAYLAYWQHLGVTKYRFVKSGEKVSRFFNEHITHWMALPQPPKGDAK